jgi:YVTN family beta-propeller protein
VAVVAVLAGMLAAVAPMAAARNAYVVNSGSDSVSVIDTATNGVVGAVAVGGEPADVAIEPDGRTAYVANEADGTVSAIDTKSNAAVGLPIAVGSKPRGIAVTPDGRFAYVSNLGDNTVSVIDTATNSTVGTAIPVGVEPEGVAISPDGQLAFVAQRGGEVSVINTGTKSVVESASAPLSPARIAIGPRGGRAFVTDAGSDAVLAFNPLNGNSIGGPIPVGTQPAGIAIEPSGVLAYAASPVSGTLTPIDTSLDIPVGAPISFPGATGVAIEPDGLHGYVTDGSAAAVSVLDTTRGVAAGTIPVGTAPSAVAVVPNQGPRASFWVSPTRRRAKKKLTFHAAGSKDPDGKVENYVWSFGDGGRAEGPEPTRIHRYRKPGIYTVTMTATDNEGCSTELVFTGQTASCNGSAAATMTTTITVLDSRGPILRFRGAGRKRLQGQVAVLARCPREPCSLRAGGAIVTAVERAGGMKLDKHSIGTANAPSPTSAWRRLVLRIPSGPRRAAMRALRSGGSAKARVSVLATDTMGNQTLLTQTIKLILP